MHSVHMFTTFSGAPLTKRHWGGTDYRIAAIPFGGYVKMFGETPDSEVAPEERGVSFTDKPVAQRMAIVFAGPAVNLIFPVLLFTGLFMVGMPVLRPVVGEVDPGSPAAQAGIEVGDEILSVGGNPVRSGRRSSTTTRHPCRWRCAAATTRSCWSSRG